MNEEKQSQVHYARRVGEKRPSGIVMSHAYGNTHLTSEELSKFENGPLAKIVPRIKERNERDSALG
jgi:hypothetical protein